MRHTSVFHPLLHDDAFTGSLFFPSEKVFTLILYDHWTRLPHKARLLGYPVIFLASSLGYLERGDLLRSSLATHD